MYPPASFTLTPRIIEPTANLEQLLVSGVRNRASVRNTEYEIRWVLLLLREHEYRSCCDMDPVVFEIGTSFTSN